jgi:predicted phosphoribosyltransferase
MVPGGSARPRETCQKEVVMMFADRDDAGRQLAARLGHLRGEPVVVLGLLRGGVPVAFQVAQALGAPLDVIVVRKLGVPFQPELAMGAVGEGGVLVINRQVVHVPGCRRTSWQLSRRGSMPQWKPVPRVTGPGGRACR